MVGESLAIGRVNRLIEQVAPTSASVVITGESGTGKERVARMIHERSPRRDRPFVAINCSASADSLIESDLFGHERGAFTGAQSRREGCFERANGGTLLLDEITEMRPEMQAKLLRVLEEREVLRLGGTKEIRFDVRVLAACNQPPLAAVRLGKLRLDLYHRLKVFLIALLPLRERIEDIPPLVEEFVRDFNREHHRSVEGIEPDCLDALKAQPWEGNVRELRNAVEYAVIVSRSTLLSVRDLPPEYLSRRGAPVPFTIRPGMPLDEVEREFIARTLALFGGNKVRAAEALGIGRTRLYALLRRYNANAVNCHLNGRAHRNSLS